MNERELSEKLSKVVNLAQEKIITLLTDYSNNLSIEKAKSVFEKCPIELENIDQIKNEFNKSNQVGGYATQDKIVIRQKDVEKLDLNTQQELDNMLGTIIHEYAHKFRQIDNQYGNLFEEASATIFAEMCVNYSKVKNNEDNKMFNMLTSIDYQKAESQVRGILYALKQKNMDVSMMTEYIIGDENNFKQECTQTFGSSFDNYFKQANNTPLEEQYTNVSEDMLTQTLTEYIKNNGLGFKDYWSNNKDIVSSTNLYFSGSPTLSQSVVNAGKVALKENEKDLFNYFEYDVKVNKDKTQFVDNEKRERIKTKIKQDFSLSGKSKDEIYDSIIDLCSSYIQHKSQNDEESKIFIDEIKKEIPNIDNFVNTFKELRVSRLDNTILENINLENINYSELYSKMNNIKSNIQINEKEPTDRIKEIEEEKKKLQQQKEELLVMKQNNLENVKTLKYTMGFANIILLSFITIITAIIIGLVIFNIFN